MIKFVLSAFVGAGVGGLLSMVWYAIDDEAPVLVPPFALFYLCYGVLCLVDPDARHAPEAKARRPR